MSLSISLKRTLRYFEFVFHFKFCTLHSLGFECLMRISFIYLLLKAIQPFDDVNKAFQPIHTIPTSKLISFAFETF